MIVIGYHLAAFRYYRLFRDRWGILYSGIPLHLTLLFPFLGTAEVLLLKFNFLATTLQSLNEAHCVLN